MSDSVVNFRTCPIDVIVRAATSDADSSLLFNADSSAFARRVRHLIATGRIASDALLTAPARQLMRDAYVKRMKIVSAHRAILPPTRNGGHNDHMCEALDALECALIDDDYEHGEASGVLATIRERYVKTLQLHFVSNTMYPFGALTDKPYFRVYAVTYLGKRTPMHTILDIGYDGKRIHTGVPPDASAAVRCIAFVEKMIGYELSDLRSIHRCDGCF